MHEKHMEQGSAGLTQVGVMKVSHGQVYTLRKMSQNVIVFCRLVLQNSPSELFHMSLRTSKSRLPHFSAAKHTCRIPSYSFMGC